MKILSKIFRNKLATNKNAEGKSQKTSAGKTASGKKSLNKAESAQLSEMSQSAIEALIQSDNEKSLRLSAVEYLSYGKVVCELAFGEDQALARSARKRIAGLLDKGEITSADISKDIKNETDLLSIAGFSKESTLQDQVLQNISDEAQLVELCLSVESPRLRRDLAERIQSKDKLPELLTKLKNKDNTAYKIVKAKSDAWKNYEKQANEVELSMQELCASAEALCGKGIDKDFQLKLTGLKTRWATTHDIAEKNLVGERDHVERAKAREALGARFDEALKKAEEQIRIHKENQEEEARKAKQKQKASPTPEQDSPPQKSSNNIGVSSDQKSQASSQRQVIIDGIKAQILALYALNEWNESIEEQLNTSIAEFKEQWALSKQHGKLNQVVEKNYFLLIDAVQELADRIREAGPISSQIKAITELQVSTSDENESIANDDQGDQSKTETQAEEKQIEKGLSDEQLKQLELLVKASNLLEKASYTEILVEAWQVIGKQKELHRKQEEQLKKEYRAIGGLIRKANQAAKEGRLKKAVGIRHAINEKAEPLSRIPTHLASQIESINESIDKLLDWQNYAVRPKKEGLIQSMEALVGVEMDPEALANKIKGLQAEWKQLRQSGEDRNENLWEQFNAAAQKAYEPCRTHFDGLAKVRAENLEKRKALVQQLESYLNEYDWTSADWKQVEKTLSVARQEWYGHAPVERASNKSVQQEFDRIIDAIQSKINEEYTSIKKSKKQLIDDVAKLVGSDDIAAAIETVKRHQASWKNIGRCGYKDEDALWKEFRGHCDAIFEKRATIAAAQKSELDANAQSATTIIEKLESLSEREGQELLESRSEKEELMSSFAEVGELPKSKRQAIRKRYDSALTTLERKQQLERVQKKERSWNDVFTSAEKLNQYHLSCLKSVDPELSLEDIQTSIESVPLWPEGAQQIIKSKLERVSNVEPQELSDNESDLRMLCIRAEILADLDSPQEDQNARMQYQVRLLQEGFGKNTQSSDAENISKLSLEWAAVGPVEEPGYTTLHDRFSSARKTLIHKV